MVVATIPVSDLERSKAFYGGTLGLELRWGVRPLSGSGAERPVRFPSSSGRPPGPSPTLAHFEVTDIEAVIKDLEAKGDRNGAAREYWSVARFGQVMDSQAHTRDEHWAGGTALQALAYKQLQALSEKEGNPSEAGLFSYLAAKFDPVRGGPAAPFHAGASVAAVCARPDRRRVGFTSAEHIWPSNMGSAK